MGFGEIYIKIHAFKERAKEREAEPTTVYMGRNTLLRMQADRTLRYGFKPQLEDKLKFMGMDVVVVYRDEYLEFGVAHDVQ